MQTHSHIHDYLWWQKQKFWNLLLMLLNVKEKKTQNNANSLFSTKILILYFSFNKTGTILPLFELKHGTRRSIEPAELLT